MSCEERPTWTSRTMLATLLALAVWRPAAAECPYSFDAVDQALADLIQTYGLPGASMHVERDDDVLYQVTLGGYALETIVPIASATKWVSAAVVMSLVDDGLITLDDTTGQWLGWEGERGAITIRQLFSHTSGIDPNEPPCVGDPASNLADCAAAIYAQALVASPGSQFNYGSSSMHVAGYICTVASGRTWGQLFQERIRGPLGMTRSFFNSAANPRIDGGLASTLPDYASLMRMFASGGQFGGQDVLSPGAVAVMMADQTGGAAEGYTPPCIGLYGYRGYGVGNWIGPPAFDGGAVSNLSPGRFSFTPWWDPHRRLFGIVMVERELLCAPILEIRGLVEFQIDSRRAGNANCDARVNFSDINPFVAALSGSEFVYLALGGTQACWDARLCWGDLDGDGAIDFGDIDPFVAALAAGE